MPALRLYDPLKERDTVLADRGLGASSADCPHVVGAVAFSWLLGCRRLGVRYERRADLLQGLLSLACALVCCRFLSATDRP